MEVGEYSALDAVGLRELLSSGDVSAVEVENAARRAIEQVNPDLNAITGSLFESALHSDPTGSLAGVPFAIKDSVPFARGVPFSLGSRGIRGAVAHADTDLMERFRAAGLVTIAQTTQPELGLSFSTESLAFGVTRNPWALDRGVGGSSGGAAALVAAGALPLAHASDAAGSIRVPASQCGLVGLKPGSATLIAELGLSRTVRDTAALLAAVTGRPIDERRDPGSLRVGVTTAAWSGVNVDPRVAAVATSMGRELEWIGHRVVAATPALSASDVIDAEMLAAWQAGRAMLAAPVQPDRLLLEGVSRTLLDEALLLSEVDVASASAARARVTRAVETYFESHDLLLTPTFGQLPLRHGTLDYNSPDYSVREWIERILEVGPFTAPFNVSGHPAISLPLGESAEGLPIGVQLVAARRGEELLLRVAAQLEQSSPWKNREPPIFAH